MAGLAREEKDLQDALPLGANSDEVRTLLRSKGISFQEEKESSEVVVLERDGKRITAAPGDQLISARVETGASQFPCGYDLEIVVLFDQDARLKQQYVRRLRVCP